MLKRNAFQQGIKQPTWFVKYLLTALALHLTCKQHMLLTRHTLAADSARLELEPLYDYMHAGGLQDRNLSVSEPVNFSASTCAPPTPLLASCSKVPCPVGSSIGSGGGF